MERVNASENSDSCAEIGGDYIYQQKWPGSEKGYAWLYWKIPSMCHDRDSTYGFHKFTLLVGFQQVYLEFLQFPRKVAYPF